MTMFADLDLLIEQQGSLRLSKPKQRNTNCIVCITCHMNTGKYSIDLKTDFGLNMCGDENAFRD